MGVFKSPEHEPIRVQKLNGLASSVALFLASYSTFSVTAVDRTALAELAVASSAHLAEGKRAGHFQLKDAAPLAADIARDPLQGVYVPSTFDTTKVWVRDLNGQSLTPFMFGAVGNGVTNDLAALQAMSNFYFNNGTVIRDYYADWTINAAISGQFIFGPTAYPNLIKNRVYHYGGKLRIQQLTATFETMRVQFLNYVYGDLSITVFGIGNSNFASRTCAVGVYFTNCSIASFTSVKAWYFWLAGGIAYGDTGNDTTVISLNLGSVSAEQCGSGYNDASSLTANWSLPVNSGGAQSGGQRTQLTVDALPDATIETYQAIGDQQLHVWLNGYLYFVWSIDRVNNTISVFPWIDSTIGSTGTLLWVIGAGLWTLGNNSSTVTVTSLNTKRNGRGLGIAGLYGPRITAGNPSYNRVGVMIGRLPTSAHLGTSLDGLYTEGNGLDYCINGDIGGTFNFSIGSTTEIDIHKVRQIGVQASRRADNSINVGTISDWNGDKNSTIVANGKTLWTHDHGLTAPAQSSRAFNDHGQPPRILTQYTNTQSVFLKVLGSGEYNRLFGYKGSTWRYVGTGANGAPTGTITFNPPAGGTINGGAVGVAAAFSTFTGVVDFEIIHTDIAQLTWVVRVVAGQSVKSGSVTGSAQADSVAADVAALKTDFNALLAKLRTAMLLTP